MPKQNVTLIKIFDSDLDELLLLRSQPFESEAVEAYLEVMIDYLSGNRAGLETAIKTFEARDDDAIWRLLSRVTQARLQIRTLDFDTALFSELEKLARTHGEWQGEVAFILSNKAAAEKDHAAEKKHALNAWKAFKKQKASRKAVRALMNYVAAQSYLEPEKHYLRDHTFIYREAKRAGDRTSIGVSLLNLSKEYQRLGAHTAALKHAQRAVAVLSKNSGNLSYYFALLHRIHLYCEMEAFIEARADLEIAACSDFQEVQAAVAVLCERYPETKVKRPTKKLTTDAFNWAERLKEASSPRLSKLEQKVIELLTEGPHTAKELIEALYGTQLSQDVTQNRLNNLLSRLRKKFPKLIRFSEGSYFLAEMPFLPQR
jgi:tetratricopeptide (TPR) repeat protein